MLIKLYSLPKGFDQNHIEPVKQIRSAVFSISKKISGKKNKKKEAKLLRINFYPGNHSELLASRFWPAGF